ncbi:hypothetical protein niasHS_007052 [Heterodera schachtii]|uniref:Uncharacterized protein n=1 Tax=Heterodera schachtii TaxID=97005 RepID=A0ABD2JFE0_HETSC
MRTQTIFSIFFLLLICEVINSFPSKSSESGEPPANGEEVAEIRKKRQAEEVTTEESPSETSDAEGVEGGQSAAAGNGKASKNKGKKNKSDSSSSSSSSSESDEKKKYKH